MGWKFNGYSVIDNDGAGYTVASMYDRSCGPMVEQAPEMLAILKDIGALIDDGKVKLPEELEIALTTAVGKATRSVEPISSRSSGGGKTWLDDDWSGGRSTARTGADYYRRGSGGSRRTKTNDDLGYGGYYDSGWGGYGSGSYSKPKSSTLNPDDIMKKVATDAAKGADKKKDPFDDDGSW